MIRLGKKNVLGVLVDAVDYEAAIHDIMEAAYQRRALAVSALAVHGLITGVLDPEQKYRLNSFDLILADGQPVRWALNWLYGSGLPERVYGPDLTIKVCGEAARLSMPVYFYGSTQEILNSLKRRLTADFPNLQICGMAPSKFRSTSECEKREVVCGIKRSGAALAFVGLGCPRQEVWTYEYAQELSIPVVSVGAAFAFHAGAMRQAPRWMQRRGLEWLFRLGCEPRRLWRRYLLLNPLYLFLLLLQSTGFKFATTGLPPSRELLYG
jgi:N-acetylglucosaminyldiphosphoundecaprenol N-acetyl-beta-D-mannosaminyltransferase